MTEGTKNKKQVHRIPQQLRITCDAEEFRLVEEGLKTFDLMVSNPRNPIVVGDILTIEETSDGEITGNSISKRISHVTKTGADPELPSEEIAKKGLTIFGFVDADHRTLDSIYSHFFTVSVGIDKFPKNVDELPDVPFDKPNTWEVVDGPHFTPAFACPNFLADSSLLENLHIDRWPEGRYSVTLMLYVDFDKEDPPYEVEIVDAIVMVFVDKPDSVMDMQLAELHLEAIMNGEAINLEEGKHVEPLTLDGVGERVSEGSNEEGDFEGYPEILTEQQMKDMIAEAKERGEDVSKFEDVVDGRSIPEDEMPENIELVPPPGKV